MSIDQVAACTNQSRYQVQKLLDSGILPYATYGKKQKRVRASDVLIYMCMRGDRAEDINKNIIKAARQSMRPSIPIDMLLPANSPNHSDPVPGTSHLSDPDPVPESIELLPTPALPKYRSPPITH